MAIDRRWRGCRLFGSRPFTGGSSRIRPEEISPCRFSKGRRTSAVISASWNLLAGRTSRRSRSRSMSRDVPAQIFPRNGIRNPPGRRASFSRDRCLRTWRLSPRWTSRMPDREPGNLLDRIVPPLPDKTRAYLSILHWAGTLPRPKGARARRRRARIIREAFRLHYRIWTRRLTP